MDRSGFTMCDAKSDEVITLQKGVFRTNCLDWYDSYFLTSRRLMFENSLDRTNFVQDILSRSSLEQYLLLVRREWVNSHSLWSYHRELWAENGDALSRIYAGTGALNTSFTRSGKRTFAGKSVPCCIWDLAVDWEDRRLVRCNKKCLESIY